MKIYNLTSDQIKSLVKSSFLRGQIVGLNCPTVNLELNEQIDLIFQTMSISIPTDLDIKIRSKEKYLDWPRQQAYQVGAKDIRDCKIYIDSKK